MHTRTTATAKAQPVCLPAARAVVAALGAVGEKQETGSNAAPQCVYTVPGKHLVVTVNLDASPQPYARLERAIVEDGQQFSSQRIFSPPVTVPHLGLDAAWVPDTSQLLTTDGVRLITVTVDWPHSRQAQRRALSRREAALYLLPLHKQAAEQTES
jgi:hypothetical protein